MKRWFKFLGTSMIALTLVACTNTGQEETSESSEVSVSQTDEATSTEDSTKSSEESSSMDMDEESMDGHEDMEDMDAHMEMAHNRNEEAPTNMTEATDPLYPVGSKVHMTEPHMSSMEGVTAEVTGAYDTTLYMVTFTPENSDMEMADHKWVVAEEMTAQDDDESFEEGDTVTLLAKHMEGMEGQEAVITGIQEGPAYMVSFEPNDGSEPFTNHKWMSEDELESAE